MAETLFTERLRLEPWSDSHLAMFGALARTPAVVRFIGDGTTWSDARVHDVHARNLAHWAQHDFGWRVAVQEGRAVGLIALNFAGEGAGIDPGEYEIGWWLAPEAWGRGLAREGAAAVRDEAFGRVRAPSVVARIAPGNAASLGVAQAIGLTRESDSVGRGGEPIAVLRGLPTRPEAPAAAPSPTSR